MKMSRRQFLTLAVGAIGTHSAAAWGLDRLVPRAQASFDAAPAAADTVGQPEEHTMAALMALVAAYVGPYGSTGHYRAYFGWRAETLPGYLSVYEDFTAALDAAAQHLDGTTFTDAADDVRQTIIRDALELPDPASELFNPTYTDPNPTTPLIFEEQLWQRFHSLVLGEIIYVFINTNAWIMLGYNGWPSQQRGLDDYTNPIPATDGGQAHDA
jgi:hypothetical protein